MLMELSAACCRHHARCNKHQWDPDPHRTTGRWHLPPLAVLLSAPAVGLVPAALMLLYTFPPVLTATAPPRRRPVETQSWQGSLCQPVGPPCPPVPTPPGATPGRRGPDVLCLLVRLPRHALQYPRRPAQRRAGGVRTAGSPC